MFNLNSNNNSYESLKILLGKGIELGLDYSELISKIDNIIKSENNDHISIVLLGSFSDGKTSAIAGLMGKLLDNMIIDQDESSDQLSFYSIEGMKNVQIIDTPGLFGTKEKEIDGKTVKYSDITIKYISEANVIIYVCDAVNPLKDSHVEIIRKVLRDFGKLQSTIFVLNKMDEAGANLNNDESFSKKAEIKKANLVSRLCDTIGLSEEEKSELHIVCIAADPKGSGMDYWLNNRDTYLKKSHIKDLEYAISSVAETKDTKRLKDETSLAVIKDVVSKSQSQLELITQPVELATQETQSAYNELSTDCRSLRGELVQSMGQLRERLLSLQSALIQSINGASMDTLPEVIETQLGVIDGNINFYILDSTVQQSISEFTQANDNILRPIETKFCDIQNNSNTILSKAVETGIGKLGGISIDNKQVLSARDTLKKYIKSAEKIKFKPHGAKKVATYVTKGAGAAAGVLTLGLEVYHTIQEQKMQKEFVAFKEELKSKVKERLFKIISILNNEQEFFKYYAPSYIEMSNLLQQRNVELIKLQNQVLLLRQFNEEINRWVAQNS